MALSPLYLVFYPSVASAALWVTTLSLGEIFWSPRNYAFIAGLAPVGREGLFIGLLSLKDLFTSIPSSALNGWLNEAFNPNCPHCRDSVGHFCSQLVPTANASLAPAPWPLDHANSSLGAHHHGYACATTHGTVCIGDHLSSALHSEHNEHNGSSALHAEYSRGPADERYWNSTRRCTHARCTDGDDGLPLLACPQRGCHGCPGWDGRELASTLWLLVVVLSVVSPLLVMLCLPFLRGGRGSGGGGSPFGGWSSGWPYWRRPHLVQATVATLSVDAVQLATPRQEVTISSTTRPHPSIMPSISGSRKVSQTYGTQELVTWTHCEASVPRESKH